jgi:hypothetical protein
MIRMGCKKFLRQLKANCVLCFMCLLLPLTALETFSANLTAAPDNSRVALVWNAIPGAASYNVKRALSVAGTFATVVNLTATNYVDAPLLNGVTYFYSVAAVTNSAEFTSTVTASATPLITPGTPAMMYGDSARLNRPFAKDPTVVRFQGHYFMYYSQSSGKGLGWSVGIAQSDDLVNWSKVGDFVQGLTGPDKNGLAAPCGRVINGHVHLFYQSYTGSASDRICHAVSTNGIDFVRDTNNAIFGPIGSGIWNNGRAIDADHIQFNGKMFLFCATRDTLNATQEIVVATAPIGPDYASSVWQQINTNAPSFPPVLSWEGKCIEGETSCVTNGQLYMFYGGDYNNHPQQIGCASSPDGTNWTRLPILNGQPFFPDGAAGTWNGSESGHPGVFIDDDGQTYLFYQGNNDNGSTWYLSVLKLGWNSNGPFIKPGLVGLADFSTATNTAKVVNLALIYPAPAVSNVTLTAFSSNTGLVANAGLVFTGTGAGRTLTATPQVGQTGSTHITVIATDTNGIAETNSFFLNVGFSPPASLPLVLDMVGYNPGEPHFDTQFADPAFAKNMGYNGKVFYLFDSAHLAVDWDVYDTNILAAGTPDRAWVDAKRADVNQKYTAAKAAGLDVYCLSDLILFPKRLVSLYGLTNTLGNINDTNTELWLRRELNLMFTQFPQLDGIVVRIGETYLQDAPYHQGKIDNPTSPSLTIIPLMNVLRDEVCVKLGKKVIFRTWNSFDVDLNNFLTVSAAVEPHTNLIWSIKHAEGDFHRGNNFSKVMGQGRHKFVVEVQCAREYEGKGAHPEYIANGVIEGFEEHLTRMSPTQIRSLRDLYQQSPLFYGVWTWSRGGGWEGPYLKNELWPDLNAWVMAQWALNPAATEESLFNRYAVERLQLPTNQVANFRQLALLSAQAVYRGKRSTGNYLNQWWNRDQYFRFPFVPTDAVQRQVVLDDQDNAVAMWDQMVALADGLTPPDPLAAEMLRSSTRYGQNLFRMWRAVVNLSCITTNGPVAQIRDWLAVYDGCWTNYAALARQYSNTIATYYVEPSQRMSAGWGMDPPVILPLVRAAVAATVTNGPTGIIETFDSGFPGSPGQNGWSDAWNYTAMNAPVISNSSPINGGGNYLVFTQTIAGDSALRRSYLGKLSATNDQTVRLNLRVDTMSNFATASDYVTVTDGTASIGGSSSESSFIIRAYGASPGGTMPGITWALYNGGKNRGGYNAANWVNSGMSLVAGKVYAFAIALHPAQLSYDVTISDGTSSVTKTNLGFRDNAFALPDTLVFNARIASTNNTLAVAVDSIAVAPRPVPPPLLGGTGHAGTGYGFSFPSEPGEAYIVQQATNLNAPVNWQAVTAFTGINTTVQFTDETASNSSARFYRLQVGP